MVPPETPQNVGKPEVILWADTFNNHFTPAVAKAAVEVLEMRVIASGYRRRVSAVEDRCTTTA